MPLFKSLRSKASSRKSVASSIKTNKDEKDTDFAPHLKSSATYGSVRSTQTAALKAKTSSPAKQSSPAPAAAAAPPPPSAPSLPRNTSSPPVADANGSTTNDAGLMRSFSGVSSSLHSRGEGSIENGPRPSELFAGKGVQWGAVKLVGPSATPASIPASNTTEDMQNFLKMRRQWKPTFATEDDNEKLNKGFQPPNDLSQLSFASGDKIQGQGLMSFKELEESHKRKEQLLSAAPLGGSLWDEAETSKAASARMTKGTLKAPIEPNNHGKKPGNMFRQASNRSTGSIKSARKRLLGGQKEKTSANADAVPVPARNSSAKVISPSDHSHLEAASSTGGGALGMTGMAPPIAASDMHRTPDDAVTADSTVKEAPILAQEEANTVIAPAQEVEHIAAASELPSEAPEKDTAGSLEAQQAIPGALDSGNETKNNALSEPVADGQTIDQAEPAVSKVSDKHIESVAVDDADKTLTTNDVEKMAGEGEETKEELGAVSTIPQESTTSQEAALDEPILKLEPIAQAEINEVTHEVPPLTS